MLTHLRPVLLLDLLHRGERAAAALLAVQREGDADRLGAGGADDLERLAHRGAGRDDVVDDQHASVERRADERPPSP